MNTPGVINIGLLTSASDTVNLILILLVPAVFVTGLGYALRVRSSRPQVYAGLAAEPDEPTGDAEVSATAPLAAAS